MRIKILFNKKPSEREHRVEWRSHSSIHVYMSRGKAAGRYGEASRSGQTDPVRRGGEVYRGYQVLIDRGKL